MKEGMSLSRKSGPIRHSNGYKRGNINRMAKDNDIEEQDRNTNIEEGTFSENPVLHNREASNILKGPQKEGIRVPWNISLVLQDNAPGAGGGTLSGGLSPSVRTRGITCTRGGQSQYTAWEGQASKEARNRVGDISKMGQTTTGGHQEADQLENETKGRGPPDHIGTEKVHPLTGAIRKIVKRAICDTGATPSPHHHRHEGIQHQIWEGGKQKSKLNRSLLDKNWRDMDPHQRTPVKYSRLGEFLKEAGYSAKKTQYLVKGFEQGFRLRLDRSVAQLAADREKNTRKVSGNNKTSIANPKAVEAKLTKELEARRMIGPFSGPVFNNYVVSPLGLRKKKDPGKFRIIHDLSSPFEGTSVNSAIPTEAGSVSYDTVDSAIALIQMSGPNSVLAKTDIEHAYKLIPIHPEDIPALGIRWFQDWLWDVTLPMGSRSGCAIFETFSEALQFIAESKGCGDMCHVLDDFLMVSVDDTEAEGRLNTFLNMCEELGVPVVAEKTEKGRCIVFLGVTLDTIKMEARLPTDKLERCLALVTNYQKQQKITVSQLESLTGLLNFACQVVVPGRPFLRRLYSLKEGMKKRMPHFRLKLSQGTKQDLNMWESFLRDYNGVTMFIPQEVMLTADFKLEVSTSQQGWVVVKDEHFILGPWPEDLSKKETELGAALFPWLVVVKVWGDSLKNTRVRMELNNEDLVHLINSQNHKNKFVMEVVREWVGLLLRHNMHWTARQARLVDNDTSPDLFSMQVSDFMKARPGMRQHPAQATVQAWPWN